MKPEEIEAETLADEWERKELTILFADIRGFTPFSEYQSPDVIFRSINLYLSAMVKPIVDHSGMLDKIMGDAVMAIFGAKPVEGVAAENGVKAAFSMLDAVREVNYQRMKEGFSPLDIGIGLATGPVVVGYLGGDRRTFSAIGHHVNMAARLEGQARAAEILIDETTFRKAGDAFKPRFTVTSVSLKGFTNVSIAYSSNPGRRESKADKFAL